MQAEKMSINSANRKKLEHRVSGNSEKHPDNLLKSLTPNILFSINDFSKLRELITDEAYKYNIIRLILSIPSKHRNIDSIDKVFRIQLQVNIFF